MNTAAVFDFDGTLMDTEPAIMASFEHVFRKYRTVEEFTPERRIKVLGPALDLMMKEFFPEMDPWVCVEEYRRYQRENLRDLIHPMPGAVEMLAKLSAMEVPCAIVSTRYFKSLAELLKLNRMDGFMSVVLGNDSVSRSKPDPEGILKAWDMLGKENCFYIGDSVMDVEAGRNAGAVTVAYPSNEGKRNDLIAAKPDYLIEQLSELPDLIRKES
ncbi:MAG: HAD-IA family hydrolase [Solobacterium sp.]|nr:HAD-IA family hydrolase [Solobacterium sp.]